MIGNNSECLDLKHKISYTEKYSGTLKTYIYMQKKWVLVYMWESHLKACIFSVEV